VKQDLPIGNADDGIDFDAIRSIYRQWNKQVIRNRCWECRSWPFCSVCLSQSEDEHLPEIDCKYKNQTENVLTDYLLFKENQELQNMKDFRSDSTSVKDYIRSL
jgi:hypothetical protein